MPNPISPIICSSLLLSIPLCVFAYNKKYAPMYEYFLALLLFINMGLSFSFWMYPINKCTIHIWDGIFGKISLLLFSAYILFIKPLHYSLKLAFLCILLTSLTAFYYSDKHSAITWGSAKHIEYHCIFHIFIMFGCIFAFIPTLSANPHNENIPLSKIHEFQRHINPPK